MAVSLLTLFSLAASAGVFAGGVGVGLVAGASGALGAGPNACSLALISSLIFLSSATSSSSIALSILSA